MNTTLLQEEGQWTLKKSLAYEVLGCDEIVGKEEECVAKRVLGCFVWGVLGFTEAQGEATEEDRGSSEPVV